MTKRKRNYQAEYARRITKGLSLGRTRSQARGHPGVGQVPSKPPPAEISHDPKLEHAFRLMRDGQSLGMAAKEVHVAPERLRRYLAQQGIAERKGRRWVVLADNRRRRVPIFSKGESKSVTVNLPEAQIVGAYMSGVSRFLADNNPAHIAIFRGGSVTDVRGKAHLFETNPNTLYQLTLSGNDSFEAVYRIIV